MRFLAKEPGVADAAILLAAPSDLRLIPSRIDKNAASGFEQFVKSAAAFVNAQDGELLDQWNLMLRSRQPIEVAHSVKVPALIVVGTRDWNVLQSDAEALRAAWGGPAQVLEVPADHDFEGAHISIATAIGQLFDTLANPAP